MLAGVPLASPAGESATVVEAIQERVQEVFEKCRGAIVRIEAADQHGRLSGTGFFIDPNGCLYTSYTVGGETREIVVNFEGRQFPAKRVIGDRRSGVAILKIESETPFLMFGQSRALTIASPVIAIGFPMDLPLTPAFGTVGGFDLKHMGRYFATTHIRANVAVQRGEGGAPLLNLKGEVVGILISRLDSGSASFVLPIEAAEKVRKDFMRFREVRPGWIGVQVKGGAEPVAGSTARIEEVIGDAPGAKAGLRAGDVLLQFGDRKITIPEDLVDASFFMSAEDDLAVRVARDGEVLELHVQPGDPPGSRLPSIAGEMKEPGLNLGQ